MPSFLSKVFGRKKGDDKDPASPRSAKRASDPSLLEGKFEAVPSTISPSSPRFPEDARISEKGKDKEGDKAGPFGLLRSKSKSQPPSPIIGAPHLTLRLPGAINQNGDSLVASFNPQADETGGSILTRRLTPAETLLLIDACSKAITERGGLETLGVMRPHWHSASPQLQHKLISLFILSLAQQSPETTLAPTTTASAAFHSELEYTRSVHDIAAVFRWALRHLEIDGTSFGSSSTSDEWSWYHNFSEAERESSYDPRAFTTKLIPEIPSTHAALLIPTLDIISSLAAHAEANGYSGSKLAKYFGFWLLTARRAGGTEDWGSFYTRWEVSGRMLEHLFLSWLRDEDTKRPLPRRLQELVAQYPYTTSHDPTADGLLTRPRFSTRRYNALFLRIEAVYTDNAQTESSRSPVGIFTDALKSEPKTDSGGHGYLWGQVKAAATSDSDDRPLPAILSDDTINLLSLVSTDPKEQVLLGIGPASTIVTPLSPVTETILPAPANGNGVPAPVRKLKLPPSTPQSPKDWAEFSSAGFGEVTISKNFASTLLDKDLEVTEPPVERKLSKRKQNRSTVSTRTSAELPAPEPTTETEEPEGPKLILDATEIVQLDEAFIEFWRDAIVDPISSDWPMFVVAELKHPLTPHPTSTSSEDDSGGPINWIIIEEKFKWPAPPPTPVISPEVPTTSGGLKPAAPPLKRTSSPRPSFGDKKASLSATFKRFTLFGGSRDDLVDDAHVTESGSGRRDSSSGKKKRVGATKSPIIGELGEVLSEEPEPQPEVPEKVDKPKKAKKREGTGEEKDKVVEISAGVVGGAFAGTVLATTADSDEEKVEAVEIVPPKKTKEDVTKADTPTKDDELPGPPQALAEEEKEEVPATYIPDAPAPTPPAVKELEQAQKALPEIPPVPEAPVVETEPEVLPPAPESIVLHGETPGPQLALDSTEAGLHHVPEPATNSGVPPVNNTEGAQSHEPAIEHLEDKVEDPAADVGVDLDPVPIVPVDLVEPAKAEPEIVPESPVTTEEHFYPATEVPTEQVDVPPTQPEEAVPTSEPASQPK